MPTPWQPFSNRISAAIAGLAERPPSLISRSRYYPFGSNSKIRTRVLPSAAFLADI